MKKVPLFILCLSAVCAIHTASARTISSPNKYGDSLFTSIPQIDAMFSEIVMATGVSGFILKAAEVQNLEASVVRRKKYIAYNPTYVNWVNSATRSKWAIMTLLAHEIGHHVYKHTIGRKKGKRTDLELQADQFAGEVLYKLGATVEEAQQVMRYIARMEESNTHPGRMARLAAIRSGWNRAATADVMVMER